MKRIVFFFNVIQGAKIVGIVSSVTLFYSFVGLFVNVNVADSRVHLIFKSVVSAVFDTSPLHNRQLERLFRCV